MEQKFKVMIIEVRNYKGCMYEGVRGVKMTYTYKGYALVVIGL